LLHSGLFREDALVVIYVLLFFLLLPPPPRSTLFPYTTLFRSRSTRARLHPVRPCRGVPPRRGSGGSCRASASRGCRGCRRARSRDRKSTRLNSSHVSISYAVFCLKKKKTSLKIVGLY